MIPYIYQYDVLQSNTIEALVGAVTAHLNDGWTTVGGVMACNDRDYGFAWAQAIVKSTRWTRGIPIPDKPSRVSEITGSGSNGLPGA